MVQDKRAAAVALGAVGGSIITYFLSRVEKARAEPAPAGMDERTWDMILTLVESIGVQSQQIEGLISAVNNLLIVTGRAEAAPGLEDPFENASSFTTGQVICPIINRGFQLPPIPIPKNKQLVVKALPGNVTWMWVAEVAANAQNLVIAYPLVPNEAIGYFVTNADAVWVVATTVNDGIAFTVEQ